LIRSIYPSYATILYTAGWCIYEWYK